MCSRGIYNQEIMKAWCNCKEVGPNGQTLPAYSLETIGGCLEL